MQPHLIVFAVFVMVLPCLYRIEKATTNTVTQVEQLNSKFDALEKAIKTEMKTPEQWQKALNQMDQ